MQTPRKPEYRSWMAMNSRCYNQNANSYDRYGGRGITVCERWRHNYAAFLEDMGPRPTATSIERIDNDGNYEPGNCRWATQAEQNRNCRRTKLITFNGETLCMQDWAMRYGLMQETLWYRLNRGMSIERALTEPVQRHRKHRAK